MTPKEIQNILIEWWPVSGMNEQTADSIFCVLKPDITESEIISFCWVIYEIKDHAWREGVSVGQESI